MASRNPLLALRRVAGEDASLKGLDIDRLKSLDPSELRHFVERGRNSASPPLRQRANAIKQGGADKELRAEQVCQGSRILRIAGLEQNPVEHAVVDTLVLLKLAGK